MIRLIWNAILLGIVALFAAWLSNNAGVLQMQWLGYQINTSVAVLISCIILIYIVFHYILVKPFTLLWNMVAGIFESDKRAQRLANKKVAKEMDRYTLLGKGMTALLAGDILLAEKLQKQINKKFANEAGKKEVFEAQLAEAKNNTQEALSLYDSLAKNPETRLLGLRGKIRLYRLGGQVSKALEICSVLLDEKNCPAWVVCDSFELQMQEKQFDLALKTLEKGHKQDVYDKLTFKHLRASVLLEQARLTTDLEQKEKLTRLAYDADDTLLQAVLLVAVYNAQKGQVRKARGQLEKLWKTTPCLPIYKAYVALDTNASAIEIVQKVEELVKQNPTAPLNDFILADSSFKAQLWGQAKTLAEKYATVCPNSKQVWTLLVQIAEHNKDLKMVQVYQEKAELACVEQAYHCFICLTDFDEGYSVCPVCNTLESVRLTTA